MTRFRKYLWLIAWLLAAAPCIARAQDDGTRILTVRFESHALGHPATFTVVLPQAPPGLSGYPVLLVLHGLGRDQRTLLDQPDTHGLMMRQADLLVMPDSAKGWWIDSPVGAYDAMLMEVVGEVRRQFPVSRDSKHWGVIGWSMGGFGAMHFAEHHPEVVSFVGTIIGLLDFPRSEGLPENQRFTIDATVFGNDPEHWAGDNPSRHLTSLTGKDIVLVLGEQAFDRTMNENFAKAALAARLPVEIHRTVGAHVFSTVAAGLGILLPRAQVHFAQAGV